MRRQLRSRDHVLKNGRTKRRLLLEELELRQMLSASTMQPDYILVPQASSGVSGYTPAQIRAAYGFNSVSDNGSGQTIAIIDAYNDPNIASDLAAFDQAMGIAAPPSLKVVNQSGGSTLPGTDPQQGWEAETALDVEWAHAIAPGANIVLVEANSDSDTDLFAAVNYARQQAGVSVISMSWGSSDNLANASSDQALSSEYLVTPSGHEGITFVASAGDTGVPSFPAESPNVLAVGGTDLYLTASGAITSETAWTPVASGGVTYSGGGGVSQEFSGRKVPDVAYNAGVGMAVYDTFGPDHGWISLEGTSAGAPQWSALVAIADQMRAASGLSTLNGATQTLAALYAAPSSDFHDITTGSTEFESAGIGYDLATGLGSPVANNLIPYLASYGASSSTGTTTAPAAPANFTATPASSTQVSFTWSTSSGATSYDLYEWEISREVLVGTYSASATSATLGSLAASNSYSFQLVAVNSAGTAPSSWVSVTTLATGQTVAAPSAPASVTASALSSTQVSLSWSASSGATSYSVYQDVNGDSALVGTYTAGTTSATISALSPATRYIFDVVAANSAGSAASRWVAVSTPATVVAVVAPQNLQAVAASSTAVQLSWSASAGATGYLVYEWNGSQAVQVASLGSSATSTTISGQTPGATEYFFVTAYNATSSASTNWASVVMPAAATLTTPTLAATATSASTGTLSWSASAGAAGYQIYYWNGVQAVLLGAVNAATTSVTIEGLSPGSTTYFLVLAYNSTSTAPSSWVGLTTPLSNALAASDAAFAQSASGWTHWDWRS
jgi:subtilase family serine protease